MRSFAPGLLALSLTVLLVAPAHAGTYSSPMLQALAGSTLSCVVSNVGATPVNVAGTLHDLSGAVVVPTANSCTPPGVLPAGQSCIVAVSGPSLVRCSVDASSSKVRVELLVIDAAGNITASMAATKK